MSPSFCHLIFTLITHLRDSCCTHLSKRLQPPFLSLALCSQLCRYRHFYLIATFHHAPLSFFILSVAQCATLVVASLSPFLLPPLSLSLSPPPAVTFTLLSLSSTAHCTIQKPLVLQVHSVCVFSTVSFHAHL